MIKLRVLSSCRRPGYLLRLFSFLFFILFSKEICAVEIQIIPTDPTDLDHVVVRIEGARPDLCWEFTGHECLSVEDYQISINVHWVDDWEPGFVCLDMVVHYVEHCQPGLLEPGHYVVTVREYSDSQRDPTTYVQTLEFDVDSVIATQAVSWGKIKIIHR